MITNWCTNRWGQILLIGCFLVKRIKVHYLCSLVHASCRTKLIDSLFLSPFLSPAGCIQPSWLSGSGVKTGPQFEVQVGETIFHAIPSNVAQQISVTTLIYLFFSCMCISSPSEKDMLVSDHDIQVLYERCASSECSKSCYNEVGGLWYLCCTSGSLFVNFRRVLCCLHVFSIAACVFPACAKMSVTLSRLLT